MTGKSQGCFQFTSQIQGTLFDGTWRALIEIGI